MYLPTMYCVNVLCLGNARVTLVWLPDSDVFPGFPCHLTHAAEELHSSPIVEPDLQMHILVHGPGYFLITNGLPDVVVSFSGTGLRQ